MNLTRLGLAFSAVAFAASVHAQSQPIDLPAGQACDFDLRVEGFQQPELRNFHDKNGNLVRQMSTGKGFALTFTNLSTGASLSIRPSGSNFKRTFNPDGTLTETLTGHNVLVLFPTDVPAGPTTTLYVGRVVYTVDPSGVFTLQDTSGKTSDICAGLS